MMCLVLVLVIRGHFGDISRMTTNMSRIHHESTTNRPRIRHEIRKPQNFQENTEKRNRRAKSCDIVTNPPRIEHQNGENQEKCSGFWSVEASACGRLKFGF